MFSITFLVFNLHALIGKMDHIVSSIDVKVTRTCSDIALLVNIDSEGISYDSPDADVKLPISVSHRLLNIFLHHPVGSHSSRRINTIGDLSELAEYFDSLSLVSVGRLHKP